LLKYKWDTKLAHDQQNILIFYTHRGSPTGEKILEYGQINEITKMFLITDFEGKETYIPMHRVRRVINKATQEVLYEN
jgi:uncharacterized protein (UPF0248 family)